MCENNDDDDDDDDDDDITPELLSAYSESFTTTVI